MTLHQYKEKFLEELIDDWNGINWNDYVLACYQEYMDSVDEAKIAEWENGK